MYPPARSSISLSHDKFMKKLVQLLALAVVLDDYLNVLNLRHDNLINLCKDKP